MMQECLETWRRYVEGIEAALPALEACGFYAAAILLDERAKEWQQDAHNLALPSQYRQQAEGMAAIFRGEAGKLRETAQFIQEGDSAFSLRQLQAEIKPWTEHNFPDAPAHANILGMQEELGELVAAHLALERSNGIPAAESGGTFDLFRAIYAMGELAHCVLKASQGIRGDREALRARAVLAATWVARWLMYWVEEYTGDESAGGDMFKRAREERLTPLTDYLAYPASVLRSEEFQAKRADALADLIIFAANYAMRCDIDLQAQVEQTWAEVRQRDWQAYPQAGRPSPSPEGG
jgi:hypothetical protein